MKRLLIISMILLNTSCTGKPEKEIDTSNPEWKVEQLASFEDCIIYRLKDTKVYFVRCSNANVKSVNSYEECYTCGKSTCCQTIVNRAEVVSNSKFRLEK